MKVLIAGASGAIGRPLIRCLRENRHAVTALVRSRESSRTVAEARCGTGHCRCTRRCRGAEVHRAGATGRGHQRADGFPRHYTPAEMAAATERDRTVRIEGKANLLAALEAAGVRRYLLQSSGFWYAPGPGLADEREPFSLSGSPAVSAGSRRYAELENAASMTAGIALWVLLRAGHLVQRR